ncbi:MAG: ABC transporter permease, partial [Acidobacteria bacterium]|nr:ABC transporter permease [Acidobacteriota bacterium]
MAERSHSVHQLRLLPGLGAELIRSTFTLILTTMGIIWLDPASAPLAVLAAALAIGLPLAGQPLLVERDLRVRSHLGALSRFYLDALLGLVAVRTHGAERSIRREHESLLVEWARASFGLYRVVVTVEGVQSILGFGLAAWLLFDHLTRTGETGDVLLLVYWALNLPILGREIALLAQQYPTHRNVTLRLLEPLGAPEPSNSPVNGQAPPIVEDAPAAPA